MKPFRKNPVFASALTLAALIALGEMWCIYDRFAASLDAADRLTKRNAELQAMADLTPPPTREVAAAIAADVTRARHAIAAMQAELKGRGPAAERITGAKIPTARTDAYFDLATFVEKTRDLARKHDVEVRPEAAYFGFSAYAHEGPEVERIDSVFHQRLVAQYLVEALLDARPRALLLVKREAALTKKEHEDRDAAFAAALAAATPGTDVPADAAPVDAAAFALPDGPDYFAIDPRMSVRAPGYVDTTAFQFVFSGQTSSLRAFLNRLASFELPVLVREVEVEPATADEASANHPTEDTASMAQPVTAPSIVLSIPADAPKAAAKSVARRTSTAAPIVARPFSKFTVTVEYVGLVPVPATSADGSSANPADPQAQPSKAGD